MIWIFSLYIVSLSHLIRADGCNDPMPNNFGNQRIALQKCSEYAWRKKQIDKCSKDVANTDFPYMGAIGYRGQDKLQFLCGAFLISPKFAITMAHCATESFESGASTPEIIRFGNKNLDDNESHIDVKIRAFIVHPQYKPPGTHNDVALVELETELAFTKSVQPGCVWPWTLARVKDFFSPIWEDKKTNGISNLKVDLLDFGPCGECGSKLDKSFKLDDDQLCANETSFSEPDGHKALSTSPVVILNSSNRGGDDMPYVLALPILHKKCGGVSFYNRIENLVDWIEEIVWKPVNYEIVNSQI